MKAFDSPVEQGGRESQIALVVADHGDGLRGVAGPAVHQEPHHTGHQDTHGRNLYSDCVLLCTNVHYYNSTALTSPRRILELLHTKYFVFSPNLRKIIF